MFATNVFGTLNVLRSVLPIMRRQRAGHILTVSSVGGFAAKAGVGIYSGSKFALEGISESLALEVGPLGIRVTIIEPGVIRTEFRHRSVGCAAKIIPDYEKTVGSLKSGCVNRIPRAR